MKIHAVPLVAVGIAGLLLASAVGVAVVRSDKDDKNDVSTGGTTTSSLLPGEDSSTSSSVDPNTTEVTAVPAPPASLAPVPAPSSASTTSTVAPSTAPPLATDAAPCQAPPAQPAAGAPVGPAGVFTVAIADGVPHLANAAARVGSWRPKAAQVVSLALASGKAQSLCLSGPDGAGMKKLSTPLGVGRPALSFDGARLAVRAARSGGADLVVGSVEGADLKIILSSTEVGDPVWLGDGSAVITCAVVNGGRRLVSVPAGGGDAKVLRDSCPTSPVASAADGIRIAFALPDQVVVLNVTTRATLSLKIGSSVSTAAAPSWSPDSKRVAFAYNDPQGQALGIFDLSTNTGRNPFRSPALTTPSWAPAGDLIAFLGTEGAGQSLLVVKPDGTGRRAVRACQTSCSLPGQAWAPDGGAIVLQLSGAAA